MIYLLAVFLTLTLPTTWGQRCTYGERGSLTSTCMNATASYFKTTPYKFDHLDETMQCINCNLTEIPANTFDISGNSLENLNLTNANIVNMKEAAFVGLVFLKRLYLPRNYIKTIVPDTFRGIKKLEYLDVSNNSITSLLQNGFKELIHLQQLLLQYNNIRVIDNQAFQGLNSLQTLDLSYNKIPNIAEYLRNIPNLIDLNLHYNEITDITKEDFVKSNKLVRMNLAKNKLVKIKNDAFQGLESLKRLDLSANPLDVIEIYAFRGLSELEFLDLSTCRLSSINKHIFRGVHRLKELRLELNHLTKFDPTTFTGLPELTRLNLSSNYIESFDSTGVKSLGNLHSLDLSYNKLSALNHKDLLQKIPLLTYFKLKGNRWPCYVRSRLESAFDENLIVYEFGPRDDGPCVEPSTVAPEVTTGDSPKEVIPGAKMASTSSEDLNKFANAYVVYTFMTLIFICLGVLLVLHYRPTTYISRLVRNDSHESPLMRVSTHDLGDR